MATTDLAPLAAVAPAGLSQEQYVSELADFDEVVRLYRPRIFRFLMSSLGDRDTAESLTQDCFLKAYNARHQFRGESSLSTWLTRIALNLVRDHLRSRRIRFWQKTRDTALDLVDISDWLPDGNATPEARCLQQEQVKTLWAAVEQLSKQQKTVFLLRFVEEMELAEIADTTGMNASTVKSHLYRALRIVRERMGGNPQ
ncbi:RNA polymerase sigma factor [Silvibacterium dinghuense]|uniref:RNA polymerase sigma factor n=1 Tax=Silvibacterium dinghuense TaxID=1560006 RepID=UPI001E2FACC0|nr:RNA polymerase sigma factor [Silvibacterium dinghuense]